jgi:hypothetical protein
MPFGADVYFGFINHNFSFLLFLQSPCAGRTPAQGGVFTNQAMHYEKQHPCQHEELYY